MTESTRARIAPRIKQLSVFLVNRVGALQRLVTTLEEAGVHLCAVSILDAADHAVVRIVVDRPGNALEAMAHAGYSVFETSLLGVAIPNEGDFGIRRVLASLLRAELDVRYVYSLLIQSADRQILAVNVEDLEEASKILEREGFDLIHQDDIEVDDNGSI